MDEDLAMARHGAADPFPLAIDDNDIVGRHLLETDAGGLHQKAPVAVRQAQCHVSGDVITLVLAHEYAARLDEFFAQSIGHVATLFRALPLWRPAAIPTLHPKRAPARGGHEPATRTRDRATPCRAGDHPAQRRAFAPSRRADVIRWHAAGLCREVGPFGFAMVALAIAALAMLLFLLVLGAFVILIPLAGLLLAVIIAVGLFRVLIWRRL